MTAEDRACAVQLLRSAAADHLTHLDPAERDELVERISAAIDRCARKRAAEELRVAANDVQQHHGRASGTAERIRARAEALTHHEEAL